MMRLQACCKVGRLIPGFQSLGAPFFGLAFAPGNSLLVANYNNTAVASGYVLGYALSGTSGNPLTATLIPSWGIIDLWGAYWLGVSGNALFVYNTFDETIGEYTLSGTTVNASLITGLSGTIALAVAPPPPPSPFSLGTYARLEGPNPVPSPGSDSVIVVAPSPSANWSATINPDNLGNTWLSFSGSSQVNTWQAQGSSNLVFYFTQNTGPTRTETITIAGLTFTVIQAGATYAQAPSQPTSLVPQLHAPAGVAVDGSGNVYIADTLNNSIKGGYRRTAR